MAIYTRNKEGKLAPLKIPAIKGEKGTDGRDGITPNIQIGTVSTLEAGESATVTREGTKENPVFNFGIPKGEKGKDGTGGGSASIDDSTISKDKTWSSSKIEDFVLTNNAIWKDVNGENLSIEYTKEGYLREVEVWGNTVQNQDDLSDIQHLGELYVDDEGQPKLDSQGRKQYKIDIVSYSGLAYKNISYNGHSNGGKHLGDNRYSITPNGGYAMCSFQLNPSDVNIGDKFKIILEIESKTEDINWNDVSLTWLNYFGGAIYFDKKIGKQVVEGTIQKLPQQTQRFVLIQTSPNAKTGKIVFRINIIFEKESHKTTILTPCQLMKVGNVADRLYWDKHKGRYVVEKNVKIDNNIVETLKNNYKIFNIGRELIIHNAWNKLDNANFIKDRAITLVRNNNSPYIKATDNGSHALYVDCENSSALTDRGYEATTSGAKQAFDETVKGLIFQTATPQLIETNITEELKLPTYINNTYISITGGINGSIKAKAPVDGGKVIATLQRENVEIKATNDTQDELINTTMLATDEMFMMLEPLLANIAAYATVINPLANMYAAMVKRRLKKIEEVPEKYRDEVSLIINE